MQSILSAFPEFDGKTALVRANFDVPLENGVVGDSTRIEDVVNTLKLLKEHNCRIILLAHAGRPDGEFNQEFSLKPIAEVLTALIGGSIRVINYSTDYHQISIPPEPVVLVENLRFWPEEEANDTGFAQHLASLGDFYVNESFAVCHRKHASMVGIPGHLPHFAGLSLCREMEVLNRIKHSPDHPFVVVIGGAKLDTKMPLVTAFSATADAILVGGKIAKEMANQTVPPNVKLATLTADGKDISEPSAREFADIILAAKMVVWNGTMGMFEDPDHILGTKIVAEAINNTPGFTLMGGGDTETALTELNLESGIDYISTGGGAMLTYLVEGRLDAVDALS